MKIIVILSIIKFNILSGITVINIGEFNTLEDCETKKASIIEKLNIDEKELQKNGYIIECKEVIK